MRIFEQDLLAILDSWETGDLHEKEVFTSAEKLAEGYDEAYFPQMPYESTETGTRFIFSDKRYCWSILPAEILAKLAEMHHEWVMRGDIPVMRMLLEAKEEDVEKAWMKWEKYWNAIDMDERRKEVRAIGWPPYIIPEAKSS